MMEEQNTTKPTNKTKKKENNTRLIIAMNNAYFSEYSMSYNNVTHYYGQLIENIFINIALTPDKRNFFVNKHDTLYQFNTRSRKRVGDFRVGYEIGRILVTNDNKFLILTDRDDFLLTKWSIKTQQKLFTWDHNEEYGNVSIISCTYDSKYLIIGFTRKYFVIFDLKENKAIYTNEFSENLTCINITKDSESIFMLAKDSIIKFDMKTYKFETFLKSPDCNLLIGHRIICLSDNDEYLLYGYGQNLVMFNIKTKEFSKKIKVIYSIFDMKLIKNSTQILLSHYPNSFSIIDYKTFEVNSVGHFKN